MFSRCLFSLSVVLCWIVCNVSLLAVSQPSFAQNKKKKGKKKAKKKGRRSLQKAVGGKGLLQVLGVKKIQHSMSKMLRSVKRTPRLKVRKGLKRRYALRQVKPRQLALRKDSTPRLQLRSTRAPLARAVTRTRSWIHRWGVRLVVYRRKWGRKSWEKRWLGHVLLRTSKGASVSGRVDGASAEGKRLILRAVKSFRKRMRARRGIGPQSWTWKLRVYLERHHSWEVVQQTIDKQPPAWKRLPAFVLQGTHQRRQR